MSNNGKRNPPRAGGPKPPPQKQKQQQQRRPRARNGRGRERMPGMVSAPNAQTRIVYPGSPNISPFGGSDSSIVVEHREFFADIAGSTSAYSLVQPISGTITFPIQPGRPKIFPWLSNQAVLYESYDFLSLKFDYVPRCSTSSSGFVGMAVDYDARDASPSNKVSLMSYHGSVSSSPWQACSLVCDRSDLHKMGRQLYCRAGTNSQTGGDQKTYDVGNLWVAVGGQSGTTQVGELYVTYRVKLSTPQLNTAQITKSKSKYLVPASVTKAAPLGNVSSATAAGALPVYLTSSTKMYFEQAGQYVIDALATGTGLAAGAVTFTADSADNVSSTPVDIPNAAATLESLTYLLNVMTPGYFTVAAAGATTLSALVLRIAAYAPSSTQTLGTALNEAEASGED